MNPIGAVTKMPFLIREIFISEWTLSLRLSQSSLAGVGAGAQLSKKGEKVASGPPECRPTGTPIDHAKRKKTSWDTVAYWLPFSMGSAMTLFFTPSVSVCLILTPKKAGSPSVPAMVMVVLRNHTLNFVQTSKYCSNRSLFIS